MANEILKFKKGLFADLDKAAKSAGTIYVTTDEHGMYVDVSATERVRISDIIQIESARAAQPPFSTAAIYYFIEENALLKWNGTTWTQINSIKAVQDQIDAITAELYAGTDGKGTAASPADNTVRKRLTDLESAQSALATRMDTAEGDIDTLESNVDTLESQIWGTGSAAAPSEGSILDTLAKYDTRITTAQTTAEQGITDASAANTAAGNAQSTADAAKTAAENAQSAAENAQSAADKAQGDATQALTDAAEANTAAGNAQSAAENAQETADAAKSAAEAAQQTANSKATMEEVEAKNYATKTEAQGYADAKNEAIAEAKKAGTDAAAAAATAQEKADANAAKIEEITGDSGLIDTKIEEAKTAINNEVDKKINAANAMNYEGDIAAYNDLPTIVTDNIKVGDTYVVTTKFVNGDVTYHAGDLMIADGTEDEATGYIVSDLSWSHVKTGYIKEQESTLKAADLDKKITLTSYLNESLGGFKFNSVGDNEAGIKVTFDTDSNGMTTIHLDQQWGSF